MTRSVGNQMVSRECKRSSAKTYITATNMGGINTATMDHHPMCLQSSNQTRVKSQNSPITPHDPISTTAPKNDLPGNMFEDEAMT